MKLKRYYGLAVMLAAMLVSSAFAQERRPPVERPRTEGDVLIWNMEAPPLPGPQGDGTFVFVGAEGGAMAQKKTVKGAPYSAEAITETVQTLADGNRIARKNSALLYRDSEGRTRREAVLGAIGPWASAGEPSRLVTIVDPVAGVSYALNPRNRVAIKLIFGPIAGAGVQTVTMAGPNGNAVFSGSGNGEVHIFAGPGGPGGMGQRVETRVITRNGATVDVAGPEGLGVETRVITRDGAKPGGDNFPKIDRKEEDLGTQTIEGVSAQGKRITTTFPAGFFGNERPLSVVSEHWYSKELQMVVMTKHNDPRHGETTYRLTNINRANPDASLFAPPADYKVEEPKIRTTRRPREQ